MKYRPEIDGLRAIAVLPVILFHAGFSTFSGGFVGVDVFFVISGYLITSIILKDLEAGKFSFLDFYERRARRILPALFFVIICCIPFAWMWMMPMELKAFSTSVVAVSVFMSNILFWRQSGYFDTAAELKPLLHTWSLAVEEQFYIFFPIAMLILWRFGRKNVVGAIAVVAVVSLALSDYGSRYHPSFNFYWLPTRAWELAAGSLCAFVAIKPNAMRDDLLSSTGLAAIIFTIFYYDSTTPFPSLYALLPVLGTCAIILFAWQGTIVGSLLSLKSFVGIGLISYSAYLWHQPLFAFARIRSLTEPSHLLMAALAVVSVVLAYFSWRYIEVPARKRGAWPLPKRKTVFALSTAVASLLIAFGLVGHFTKGFPERFSALALASDDEFKLPKIDNGYCFFSVNDLSDLQIGLDGTKCEIGSKSAINGSAMLFGDSLAAHWEPFWDQAGKELGLKVNAVTTNWCYPAFSENFTTDKRKAQRAFEQCMFNRDYLKQHASEYDVIILAGLWDKVESDGYADDVLSVIEFLLNNTDATIVVMPSPVSVTRSSLERSVFTGKIQLIVDEKRQSDIEEFNNKMRTLSDRHDRVALLDTELLFGNYFSSNGLLTGDKLPYSLDGTHISIYGSLFSSQRVLSDPLLKKQLAEALRRSKQ